MRDIAGFVWTQVVTLLWVWGIFGLAQDPLSMLALWVPGVMMFCSAIASLVWRALLRPAGRMRPGVASFNVLAAWSMGTAALVVLGLVLLGGS